MDIESCMEIIDEAIQDEDRHVNFKFIANKLNIPANNAKTLLYQYMDRYSKRTRGISSLFVTYVISGVDKKSQMHTVRLLSQNQVNDQQKMDQMFSLVTSKHIYSISKQKPVTCSDIYDNDAHSEYRNKLNSVKIGDAVALRTNRYSAASSTSAGNVKKNTSSTTLKPTSSSSTSTTTLVKKEATTTSATIKREPQSTATSQKQKSPEETETPKAKKGTIASMFASSKPKQTTQPSSKGEPMEVEYSESPAKVKKEEPPKKEKAKPKPKATPKKKTTAKKRKAKQVVDSDDDDDDTTGNAELVLDEEDEEMAFTPVNKITYVPSTLTSGMNDDCDYVPSDSDEEMEQKTRSSERLRTKKADKSPSVSTSSSQIKAKTPEKPNATLEQFGASPVKATGPRRTKQVKKRVMKQDDKGYMVASVEWVEEEMTEQEIKEEEEREKKQVKATAAAKEEKSKTTKKTTKKAAGGNIASYFSKK